MVRRSIVCAVLVVLTVAAFDSSVSIAQQGARAPALVILVRHAERAAEPADDPALSAAGAERARALADALRDGRVTAIVTTQFRRTRETAAPLAAARGLRPEVVESVRGALPAHVEAVAAAVRRHPGGIVLVVGHSNTIPAIIAALGGPKMPDICDAIHANLFVLSMSESGARLVRSKYGAPDPESADCK